MSQSPDEENKSGVEVAFPKLLGEVCVLWTWLGTVGKGEMVPVELACLGLYQRPLLAA